MELGGPQVGVACDQALWRRGWKRKESLQLRVWNLNICIEKSRCEMLIGGDDISNDVITLDACFLIFVYIRARFRFALIGGNLTAQSMGSHRGIGGGIPALFLPPEQPRKAFSQVKEGEVTRLGGVTRQSILSLILI